MFLSASEMGAGPEASLRFAADSPWAALYDMDALFPDKRIEEEQTPTVKEDVSCGPLLYSGVSEYGLVVSMNVKLCTEM